MPNSNNSSLHQFFAQRIDQAEKLEKFSEKKYAKLTKVAHTDELAKCLHPESTDILAHQQRLSLIKKLVPKTSQLEIKYELPVLQLKSKANPTQDLLIIENALNIQNQKLAIYELLHPIAVALNLETVPALIEQTISDNRNTNTWLRQIVQNIVAPILTENNS
ncbi:DUF892 family protein [Pedobacter boryungensis]|uniref:DUF892 family protein n=1 Tax=Pedobacter boryungensis TaxID=869962 RepID=A0ABX2DAJ1_9SPHI|nr:DUF892 family protein [Pedobacter boryungensis]NQX31081.1 DUF892 family protein [Pedobacter boryungensis]